MDKWEESKENWEMFHLSCQMEGFFKQVKKKVRMKLSRNVWAYVGIYLKKRNKKTKNCNGWATEEMRLQKKKWSGNIVEFVVQESAWTLLWLLSGVRIRPVQDVDRQRHAQNRGAEGWSDNNIKNASKKKQLPLFYIV